LKEKAGTLTERFGFQDEDLTTPAHDEIVLALLEPKTIAGMLAAVGFPGLQIRAIFTEWPLENHKNQNVVGFIDLYVQAEGLPTNRRGLQMAGEERPTAQGTVEKLVTPSFSFYIEVKPEVRSFGETMRQLNLYRHYLLKERPIFILVTKTTRFTKAFNSQRVLVYQWLDQLRALTGGGTTQ
jgi:hypothetical protein